MPPAGTECGPAGQHVCEERSGNEQHQPERREDFPFHLGGTGVASRPSSWRRNTPQEHLDPALLSNHPSRSRALSRLGSSSTHFRSFHPLRDIKATLYSENKGARREEDGTGGDGEVSSPPRLESLFGIIMGATFLREQDRRERYGNTSSRALWQLALDKNRNVAFKRNSESTNSWSS